MKSVKKKLLFALLVVSLLISSFASCTKFEETSTDNSSTSESSQTSESTSDESASSSEESSEEENAMFDFSALTKEELAEYITIGEYKGLESEKIVVEITDKDVEEAIAAILSSYATTAEVTDRAVKDGDILIIDFKGYLNGELFEGGTASDQELTIGSGKYIDGFEEGLIGAKLNETTKLNLTFPENYGNEELNGKAVVFEVTVKKISEKVIPELSEEIIKKYTGDKVTTEEDFKKYLYDELFENESTQKKNLSESAYWEKVIANATVIKYPEGIIDKFVQSYIDYYTQYAALYGVTLEEYLGLSVEEFKEAQAKEAEKTYKEQMVLYAAIYAENYDRTIKEDDFNKWLDETAALMGTTAEYLKSNYSTETLESTYTYDKFIKYLYATRVEVEPKEESSESISENSSDSSENTETSETSEAAAQ